MGFPGGSVVKNPPANAGDAGERATQSNILTWKPPTEKEAWQATVHGASKSQTQLSDITTAMQKILVILGTQRS